MFERNVERRIRGARQASHLARLGREELTYEGERLVRAAIAEERTHRVHEIEHRRLVGANAVVLKLLLPVLLRTRLARTHRDGQSAEQVHQRLVLCLWIGVREYLE